MGEPPFPPAAYKQALTISATAHGDQRTPKDLPYVTQVPVSRGGPPLIDRGFRAIRAGMGLAALSLATGVSAEGSWEGRYLGGLEVRGSLVTEAADRDGHRWEPGFRAGLAFGESPFHSYTLDGYFLEYAQDFGGSTRSITAGIIDWGPMFSIRRGGLTAVRRDGRYYWGASGQWGFTVFYLRAGAYAGSAGGLATMALGAGF